MQDSLYKKHFANNGAGYALSSDEAEFARNHDTLRVGIIAERAPLQSFDRLTGEFEGVSQGMLDFLSQKTGLSFESCASSAATTWHPPSARPGLT